MVRPNSIGGVLFNSGNALLPFEVSNCLASLMMLKLEHHGARGWNRGGSAFCTA